MAFQLLSCWRAMSVGAASFKEQKQRVDGLRSARSCAATCFRLGHGSKRVEDSARSAGRAHVALAAGTGERSAQGILLTGLRSKDRSRVPADPHMRSMSRLHVFKDL